LRRRKTNARRFRRSHGGSASRAYNAAFTDSAARRPSRKASVTSSITNIGSATAL
jgi:hypothetical protein